MIRSAAGGRGRRWVAATAAGIAVLAAGAACGSSSSGGGSGSGSTAAPGAAFPVTLAGKLGTATLRSAPTRVVTLGALETDTATALGVTPVGAIRDPYTRTGVFPWNGKLDPTRTTLLTADASGRFDLEKIAALHPDVILATSDYGLAAQYGDLSRIAPTVSYRTSASADSWQDQTRRVGQALGRARAAYDLVAHTEGAISAYRAAHPGLVGATYSYSLLSSPTQILTVTSDKDNATAFFTALGLRVPAALKALPITVTFDNAASLSTEQAGKLDAQVVLIAAPTPAMVTTLRASTPFGSLPAVRAGHVQVLDLDQASALRAPTPLSLSWMLEQLGGTFAKVAGS